MNANQFGFLIIVGIALLALLSVRRRRDAIRHNVRKVLSATITGLVVCVLMLVITNGNVVAASIVTLLGVYAANLSFPDRKRRVPAKVRRRVIARFELETGEKYNSSKHELDHVIPFSRGGSSTFDNLEVISRKKNRQKADQSPWWDLLG